LLLAIKGSIFASLLSPLHLGGAADVNDPDFFITLEFIVDFVGILNDVAFRDSSVPIMGSGMSLTDLKTLSDSEMVSALQRQFLFIADVLRKNDIETTKLIAGLLGAAIQDYLENHLACAPSMDAASRSLESFFMSLCTGMIKQESPPDLTALGMLCAGVSMTQKYQGAKTTSDLLETLRRKLTS
jgi:hypothetical protein